MPHRSKQRLAGFLLQQARNIGGVCSDGKCARSESGGCFGQSRIVDPELSPSLAEHSMEVFDAGRYAPQALAEFLPNMGSRKAVNAQDDISGEFFQRSANDCPRIEPQFAAA